jgi:hypothetical protein
VRHDAHAVVTTRMLPACHLGTSTLRVFCRAFNHARAWEKFRKGRGSSRLVALRGCSRVDEKHRTGGQGLRPFLSIPLYLCVYTPNRLILKCSGLSADSRCFFLKLGWIPAVEPASLWARPSSCKPFFFPFLSIFHFFYKNQDLAKFTKNHRKIPNQFYYFHKNVVYL